MTPRRLRPAVVLAAWTVLVWTTRIRNIWTDDSLSTGGQVWRTALALAFTGFAAVALGLWLRSRTASSPAWTAPFVRAFAVWTTGVWLLRAVQIATNGHEAAFVAVHTVLAIVSIALAAWADRSVHAAAGPSDGPSDGPVAADRGAGRAHV